MLQFREGACHVLAADTKSVMDRIDQAFLASLRMAATMVETFEGSGLPARQSQRAYQRMEENLRQLIGSRGDVVAVIGQLTDMKGRSNVAETDLGCPGPWEDILTVTGEAMTA